MPAPSGPLTFARYAFPPNSHGYCGPGDSGAYFEYGVTGDASGLRAMSRRFEGAWPYLELIAQANHLGDPLDDRVVRAYWVGNRLLERVSMNQIGRNIEDRFRAQVGSAFPRLADSVLAGAVPHHSFAVFCVYPWTGLLGDGSVSDHALHVLDRCRIRSGTVVALQPDEAIVRSRPLTWDGRSLSLGPAVLETARRSIEGDGITEPLMVGDRVTLHWEWVCDKISAPEEAVLHAYTRRHLAIVNAGRPIAVL
ncbi:DUF6390 family protein [Tsukamurella soli]|uniref:DUF6390 family protein n=1 Tax=Tsukamurella soli TaxID=644556 RepID=A0ABP8JF40_9ACTN